MITREKLDLLRKLYGQAQNGRGHSTTCWQLHPACAILMLIDDVELAFSDLQRTVKNIEKKLEKDEITLRFKMKDITEFLLAMDMGFSSPKVDKFLRVIEEQLK